MAELYVGLENNQKKLIPTSSEARSGNPLGSKIALQNNVVPIGYVKCDGQQFDSTQYPALYAYLGTDVAPCEFDKSRLGEWESFTLTTTNQEMQYDGYLLIKSSSNYTIPAQDIYVNDTVIGTVNFDYGNGGSVTAETTIPFRKGDNIKISNTTNITAKVAYYKHYLCIKATSGLEETQQDYVLQSLLEADSYSTEEVATGKKWIDGKMIYRKILDETFNATTSDTLIPNTSGLNIDSIVSSNWYIPSEKMYLAVIKLSVQNGSLYIRGGIAMGNIRNLVTVEYTKAD